MTRVVIDRLRIQGLQGRAPSRAAVEAALRAALAGRSPDAANAAPAPVQRVTRPAATTLADAMQAAADTAFGGSRR